MKKTISVLLCLLLVLSFAGCMPDEVQTISTAQSMSSPASSEGLSTAEGTGINAFTGLPLQGSTNDLRPVAVFVDNHKMSWPSSGLSEADIVFEMEIWENITRFAALYSDYKSLPVVGPVREMHMPLLQCVFSAQPIFVTDAISAPCEEFIEKNSYTPYVFDSRHGQNALWDNEKRLADGMPIERTRYTDGGNLAGAIQVYGTDMTSDGGTLGFSFDAENMTMLADSSTAENVQISFTETNITRFLFDTASVRYRMEQYDNDNDAFTTTVDENTGSQLGFDNVLVLFADITEREDIGNDLYHDSLEVHFEKGGEGYYCYGGSSVSINWQKGGADQPFQLSMNGSELQIHPGTTYVAVVAKERATSFQLGATG